MLNAYSSIFSITCKFWIIICQRNNFYTQSAQMNIICCSLNRIRWISTSINIISPPIKSSPLNPTSSIASTFTTLTIILCKISILDQLSVQGFLVIQTMHLTDPIKSNIGYSKSTCVTGLSKISSWRVSTQAFSFILINRNY